MRRRTRSADTVSVYHITVTDRHADRHRIDGGVVHVRSVGVASSHCETLARPVADCGRDADDNPEADPETDASADAHPDASTVVAQPARYPRVTDGP